MPPQNLPRRLLTVAEVACAQQVTPRTVRAWLQRGVLEGQKIGPVWGVWWPEAWGGPPGRPRRRQTRQDLPPTVTLAMVRTRLRQVGNQLIAVGNQVAGSPPRRGHVFLTWRRARSLQIILALGRQHPTRTWVPHALGTDLPFWLRERSRWSRVLLLLRWYEQLRGWCHPRLLRVPGVGMVLLTEIARLENALLALESPEVHAEDPAASSLEWRQLRGASCQLGPSCPPHWVPGAPNMMNYCCRLFPLERIVDKHSLT